MGMPTDEELHEALAEAGRMRERGKDPYHVGKALLNCHYRMRQLERVMEAAELFFRSGMAIQEDQQLRKALDQARQAIERTAAVEDDTFGLG
jgi:hypothetical protein